MLFEYAQEKFKHVNGAREPKVQRGVPWMLFKYAEEKFKHENGAQESKVQRGSLVL